MFLPKPNAISLPPAASQLETGLGACNSGNSCGSQKCDVNNGDSGGGGCSWTLACTGVTSSFEYPGQKEGVDILYMITLCALHICDYALASNTASSMLNRVRAWFPDEKSTEYVMLSQYANGMKIIGNHKKVVKYLRYMFDDDICDEFDERYHNPDEVLTAIYPVVDLDGSYCESFRNFEKLFNRVKKYQKMYPIDESVLPNIIESIMI